MLLLKKATTARARMMNGRAAWKSTAPITTSSTQPRKWADRNPRQVPRIALMMHAEQRHDEAGADGMNQPAQDIAAQFVGPQQMRQRPLRNHAGGASRARRSIAA